MRIALVVPELHTHGGTERCVAALGQALVRRGHHVSVFARSCDRQALPGAPWYRVPLIPRPNAVRFASFLVMNAVVRWWARVVRGARFDVVHSTGPDVLRPDVTTFHSCSAAFARRLVEGPAEPAWQRWPRLRRLSNIAAYRVIAACERYVLCRGARRVLAVSSTLARELGQFHPIPPGRVTVVHNGVEPREFHVAGDARARQVRRDLGIDDGRPVLLFVGHNWARKGLGTLVEALASMGVALPDRRPWLLVAGGQGTPSYEREVTGRLAGAVRFLGTRTDMARLYAAADLLVLPTTHEPFGLPVVEAMASAVPVVVSRCAGVAELIEDGVSGVLLDDPASVGELAGTLGRLLADPAACRAMGQRGRAAVERLTWDEVARQVEATYADLVGRRLGAP